MVPLAMTMSCPLSLTRSSTSPLTASDSSLPISLNVTMDTLNIDTTTMLLSVSYNLRMTWLDNRLTYNNLKNMTRLNTGETRDRGIR